MDRFSSNINGSVAFPLTPWVCRSNIGRVTLSLMFSRPLGFCMRGSYRSNVRNRVCIRGEDIVSLVLFYLFFALIRISNSQQCMVTGANKGGEGWCRLATLF